MSTSRTTHPGITVAALLVAALGVAGPSAASAQSDTVTWRLDELVVVAEAGSTSLRESVAPATVLTRADVERIPARTLADVLRFVPGLVFLERDGTGGRPLSIARGFYGGGETEYVLVLVDGVPMNDLRTGAVDWSRIHPAEVERIEVLRGGGSALYGDQAVGAVIRVTTTRAGDAVDGERLTLAMGTWGDREARGALTRGLAGGRFRGSADLRRSAGYREDADADATSVAASWSSPTAAWRLQLRHSRRVDAEPGPLRSSELRADRTRANPAYGSDRQDRSVSEVRLRYDDLEAGPGAWGVAVDLGVQRVSEDRVRTILLTPDFGDTQRHEEGSWTLLGRSSWARSLGGVRIVGGVEGSAGTYDSSYSDPVDRRPLGESDGTRAGAALAGSVEWRVSDRVRIVAGARYDAIRVASGAVSTTYGQLSPRLGLNTAYSTGRRWPGNAYVSWGRAFKVPTLDQLYDARRIPVGDGATVNLSNDGLRPQRSVDVEVGLNQSIPLGSNVRADVSLAGYRIELDDEIDFDLNTFRYGNILESLHTGVEGSLRLSLGEHVVVDQVLTRGRAEFATGEFEGNQLKNIPRTVLVSSVHLRPTPRLRATLGWRRTGDFFLDDANSAVVRARDTFDASTEVSLGRWSVFATVRNLLDAGGEEGGFLLFDPLLGRSTPLLHPSGGRYLRVGLALRSSR